MGVCRNLVGIAERVTFEDPIVLRRPRVWTPTDERLRPPTDPLEPSGRPGAGKSGSRRSWSARCLLTPRISAISTTRRSFRRVMVRSIREVAGVGGERNGLSYLLYLGRQ